MPSEDYADLYLTQEWREYAEHAVESTLPMIEKSEVFLSIGALGVKPDVRMATELGFALMLGKPLVFIAEPGQIIPEGLRRAADKIIFGEIQHPKTQAKLKEALKSIAPELDS